MVFKITRFYCKRDTTSPWFSAGWRFTLFYMTNSERAIPTLYSFKLTLFVYLEWFRRYATFCIWLGFPYWGEIVGGGFGAKWPLKCQMREKHLLGGHFLTSHCAWNYLYPFGMCRCARKKAIKQEGRKSQEVYILRMSGAIPSGRISTNLGACVCLTDVIKYAKFHRYNSRGFGVVRRWSFHVAIGNQGRP